MIGMIWVMWFPSCWSENATTFAEIHRIGYMIYLYLSIYIYRYPIFVIHKTLQFSGANWAITTLSSQVSAFPPVSMKHSQPGEAISQQLHSTSLDSIDYLTHPSIHLSICLSIYIYLSIYLSLSLYLYLYLYIYISIYLSIYICMYIYMICLCIYI